MNNKLPDYVWVLEQRGAPRTSEKWLIKYRDSETKNKYLFCFENQSQAFRMMDNLERTQGCDLHPIHITQSQISECLTICECDGVCYNPDNTETKFLLSTQELSNDNQ